MTDSASPEPAEPGCPYCGLRHSCVEGCPMLEVVEEIEAEVDEQQEYLSSVQSS